MLNFGPDKYENYFSDFLFISSWKIAEKSKTEWKLEKIL